MVWRLLSLLMVVIAGTGCSAMSGVARPTASVRGMTVKDVTAQGLALNFDVDVENPNSFALPVADLDYELKMGGVDVLEGKAKPEGSIPAQGKRAVAVPVTVTFENLLAAEEAIRKGGGDVPYGFDATFEFGGKGGLLSQPVRVPVSYSGTLRLREFLRDPAVLLKSAAARRLAERVLGGVLGR